MSNFSLSFIVANLLIFVFRWKHSKKALVKLGGMRKNFNIKKTGNQSSSFLIELSSEKISRQSRMSTKTSSSSNFNAKTGFLILSVS